MNITRVGSLTKFFSRNWREHCRKKKGFLSCFGSELFVKKTLSLRLDELFSKCWELRESAQSLNKEKSLELEKITDDKTVPLSEGLRQNWRSSFFFRPFTRKKTLKLLLNIFPTKIIFHFLYRNSISCLGPPQGMCFSRRKTGWFTELWPSVWTKTKTMVSDSGSCLVRCIQVVHFLAFFLLRFWISSILHVQVMFAHVLLWVSHLQASDVW